VPYLDNYWSDSFSPKYDPPVFEVLHLPKYFGNLSNFISHAIPNFQTRWSLTMATLVAEDTGMSVYQNSEATSAYCFGPTLAW
jgi:hypothetical protein